MLLSYSPCQREKITICIYMYHVLMHILYTSTNNSRTSHLDLEINLPASSALKKVTAHSAHAKYTISENRYD
jgi:hypothetical protein